MHTEGDDLIFMIAIDYLRILFRIEYYSCPADMVDDLVPKVCE